MSTLASQQSNTYSARDTDLMAKVLLCVKGGIQIDFEKLSQIAGFKNAPSARTAWSNLKKKMEKNGCNDIGGPSTAGTDSPSLKTPKTGAKKRKAAVEMSDGHDEDDALEIPQPKKGRSNAKIDPDQVKVKEEDGEDWDTEEECNRALYKLTSSPPDDGN